MKKIIKILVVLLALFIGFIFAAPIIFKGQIIDLVNTQVNDQINAQFKFKDLNLSLIKHFPRLTVSIEELEIVGHAPFEYDTLLAFEKLEVELDVVEIVNGNYEILNVALASPTIQAKVLRDGSANWDIAKEVGAEEEIVDTIPSEEVEFEIALKSFNISNANISYVDKQGDINAVIKNLNFDLSGDLSNESTQLKTNLSIEDLTSIYGEIAYLNEANVDFKLDIDADLKNMVFKILENSLSLNGLSLKTSGQVAMKENEDIAVDIEYHTNSSDFKTVLSLVPAVYKNEFELVETNGDFKLDGFVKGLYNENVLPKVALNLVVNNGYFNYPDLPESVKNIEVDAHVLYDGEDEDKTIVDLNKMHLDIANSPFDMVLNIKTPMSDMHINGKLSCDLDLSTFSKAVPIENTKLSGKVVSNLDFLGHLSTLENEQYELFKADGQSILSNFKYESTDLPYSVEIMSAKANFSPKQVKLDHLDMRLGATDMSFKGALQNFIPYIFDDKTIHGNLMFSSTLLDANELMYEEESAEVEITETEDTTTYTIIEIPKNIDFKLQSNIGKVFYKDLEIKDITGLFILKDGVATLQDVNMNMLGGFINAGGQYNTSDIDNPLVDFNFAVSDIDVSAMAKTFNTVDRLAPIAKNTIGNISTSFNFSALLNEDFSPRYESILSQGGLNSKSITVKESNALSAIDSKLGKQLFNDINLRDIKLDFDVRDGKVEVKPFDVKLGNKKVNIGGVQGFDNSLDYIIALTLPKDDLKGASGTLNALSKQATTKGINLDAQENVDLNILVGGFLDNPKVKLDLKQNLANVKEAVKTEVTKTVTEEVSKKKEEAKVKAGQEAERIIRNAEKQAKMIVDQAKIVSDKTRAEAEKRAKEIEKQAEGKPKIARDLAKKAADKVRSEGDKKADKIDQEAETKAKEVMRVAREKAEAIKKL